MLGCGCWELNLGPLQEPEALLTTELEASKVPHLSGKGKGPRSLWVREKTLEFSSVKAYVSVSSSKVRENNRRLDSGDSFIASMRAAWEDCLSLGKVLEPHSPPVLGRTHGVSSRNPAHLTVCQSWKEHAPMDQRQLGKGAIPLRLGLASCVLSALVQELSCWL